MHLLWRLSRDIPSDRICLVTQQVSYSVAGYVRNNSNLQRHSNHGYEATASMTEAPALVCGYGICTAVSHDYRVKKDTVSCNTGQTSVFETVDMRHLPPRQCTAVSHDYRMNKDTVSCNAGQTSVLETVDMRPLPPRCDSLSPLLS